MERDRSWGGTPPLRKSVRRIVTVLGALAMIAVALALFVCALALAPLGAPGRLAR